MQRLLPALVVILATGFTFAAEPPAQWQKIEDKDAKFEVQFPGKPKETSGKRTKKYTFERIDGPTALIVDTLDYSRKFDIENAELVKFTFDGLCLSLSSRVKGSKVVSEKDSKFDKKFPARDVDIEIPDAGFYRVRLILTPARQYKIAIFGSADYLRSDEVKKFLDSFKVTD